jgi:hypothetical protein
MTQATGQLPAQDRVETQPMVGQSGATGAATGAVAGGRGVVAGTKPISLRHEAMLRSLQQMAYRRGQVLFDGQWLGAEEAQRMYRRMWWRSCLSTVELIALCGAMVLTAGVVGVVLAALLGVQM